MGDILKILLVISLLLAAALAKHLSVSSAMEQDLKDLVRPVSDRPDHDNPDDDRYDRYQVPDHDRPVSDQPHHDRPDHHRPELEVLPPLTATISTDKTEYELQDRITCKVTITNNLHKDVYLLKRNTPFEDLRTSFMTIKHGDGESVRYDGLFIRRGEPSQHDYVLIQAGSSITAKVDLTLAYAMEKRGPYTIQFGTEVKYHESTGSRLESTAWPLTEALTQHLTSRPITIRLVTGGEPMKTLGQLYRQSQIEIQDTASSNWTEGKPLDPIFSGGSEYQRVITKAIHRAAHTYVEAALHDIDDNPYHFKTWFGTGTQERVREVYTQMKDGLENTQFEYIFNGSFCEPDYFAYTYSGGNQIYLCTLYDLSPDVFGIDTKLCTIIGQLSHAIAFTKGIKHGRDDAKDLATYCPSEAAENADNYCYYSETTNVFDYGFDSLIIGCYGHGYVTRGPVYLQFTDTYANTIAEGYPKLLLTRSKMPDEFNAGFDSVVFAPNGYKYITKGDLYIRDTDPTKFVVDPGYPKKIDSNWGDIPPEFKSGFDSAATLRNGRTYVTKGSQYIRYSDYFARKVDPGYPLPIKRHWGSLPSSFNEGFDAMVVLGNGKTYVTKGKQYVRYSDRSATILDYGYPRDIKGNWGTINFP